MFSRTRAVALIATFLASATLAACDLEEAQTQLRAHATDAGPRELAAPAPTPQPRYACANIQSAEVCNATSTCIWSPGSSECTRAGKYSY